MCLRCVIPFLGDPVNNSTLGIHSSKQSRLPYLASTTYEGCPEDLGSNPGTKAFLQRDFMIVSRCLESKIRT